MGRWTAKDPIRFETGVNLYQYANGDPINFLDSTGLEPEGAKSKGEQILEELEEAKDRIVEDSGRGSIPRKTGCIGFLGKQCKEASQLLEDPGQAEALRGFCARFLIPQCLAEPGGKDKRKRDLCEEGEGGSGF